MFWLGVSALVAVPSLAIVGILILMVAGLVSLPLTLIGIPADWVPWAWIACAIIALLLAVRSLNLGRHRAASAWACAAVNIAGLITAVTVFLQTSGWRI